MGPIEFWKEQAPVLESMLLRANAAYIDALERPEVLSYLPSLSQKNVLDLGAGIGRFTTDLAKIAAHVTATDLVAEFIAKNQQINSASNNISYLVCDANQLNFPANSFDLVFVSGVFMYLEDDELEQIAKKIYGWLKPGGHLFFRDCCSSSCKTERGLHSYRRTIAHYHRVMDPLFRCLTSGSVQTYIDLFANPFRCYWLYQKDLVES